MMYTTEHLVYLSLEKAYITYKYILSTIIAIFTWQLNFKAIFVLYNHSDVIAQKNTLRRYPIWPKYVSV